MMTNPTISMIEWLKARKPELERVDVDADLIGSGLLDSLQFVNFLLFVEGIRGREIPQDQVVPSNFNCLRTITDRFFGND